MNADLQQKTAGIISTLADFESAPESMLYLGIGGNLDEWNQIKSALTQAGLIVTLWNSVSLTPAGKDLAAKINTALAAAKH